jgi:phosphatidate cytidylyltransferase
MKRVLTALVLIPVVLLLVFLPARWEGLFTLATAGVAMLAAWEYLGLTTKHGANPPRLAVILVILMLFVSRLFSDSFEFLHQTDAVIAVLAIVLILFCTFRSPIDRMMADASAAVFALVYTGLTLYALLALHEDAEGNGPSLVVFLLFVVWAGDIAALYVGRAWGRRKLAPALSPNKTWEGSVASIAGSVLVALGLYELSMFLAEWNFVKLSYHGDIWYWLFLAIVVNVAAQAGDLAESALKRSVGVKDSGSLLPGHGGVLDRIDALLLAAPVMWFVQLIRQRL